MRTVNKYVFFVLLMTLLGIVSAQVTLPYTETFDTLTTDSTNVPTNWQQVTEAASNTACLNGSPDCSQWIVGQNGTPSSGTGPNDDHTSPGNANDGRYLFVEASSGGNPNGVTVELLSPSFDLGGTANPRFNFWVHRNNSEGTDSHVLHLDIMNGAGTTVIANNVLTVDDSVLNSDNWLERTLDLSPYRANGQVRVRFRWVRSDTGARAWRPDIAIDDVSIIDVPFGDYGDAPASYGDAYHSLATVPTLYLGNRTPDGEVGSQTSFRADGDDTLGSDDEDGIGNFTVLTETDSSYSVNVQVTNTLGSAKLLGWIDFDLSGTFDADEGVSLPVTSSGTVTLNWNTSNAPGMSGITDGISYLRLRLSGGLGLGAGDAEGAVTGGEVEDYRIPIFAAPEICNGVAISTMAFQDPLLESGSALGVGAVYRFPDVTPGVDALVEIISLTAATLGVIDNPTDGEPSAFQPSLRVNNGAGEGSAEFEVRLVRSGTAAPVTINRLYATGIDIDGNGTQADPGDIREYIELVGFSAYITENPSALTSSYTPPRGHFEATQSVVQGGISTTATENMVTGDYVNVSTFRYRIGAIDSNPNNAPLTRLNSLFFRCIDYNNPVINGQTTYDFGDAPDTGPGTGTGNYRTLSRDRGASHASGTNLYLGAAVDIDTNGFGNGVASNGNAQDDDLKGVDDEDGVTFGGLPTVTSVAYSANAAVTNPSVRNATLLGWIDFDHSGTFDLDEVATRSGTLSGAQALTWNATTDTRAGFTYARFRLTTDVPPDDPTTPEDERSVGAAKDGEVEDYRLEVRGVISGRVFEDVNYGGGAGRSLVASGGAVRPGARAELYGSGGNFVAATTTDAGGRYRFSVAAGGYTVRVVNGSVSSSRPGSVAGLLPVQTFRTSGGAADPNRVGGEDPSKVDAGNGSTTLAALTNATTTPQSLTGVTVTTGAAVAENLDFGFNFDTVVSTRNSGQGSLRQFILNSNALGGEAGLAQQGSRKNSSSTNAPLPAGFESSIFMIPDGNVHPGLRAGLTNQLTGGVAVLNVTSTLTSLTGANAPRTVIDGTTQTVNVGDTNGGQLGTGGTVGVDALALSRVYRPEVQVTGSSTYLVGLDLQANDLSVRGIALYGFGNNPNSNNDANLRIGNYSRALIEQNIIGTPATSFSGATAPTGDDPCGTFRSRGDNVRSVDGDDGILRNNLIGYARGKGFGVENDSARWLVENNEIRCNAITQSAFDAVDLESAGTTDATLRGNLLWQNEGVGVDSYISNGGHLIINNTITQNGIGPNSNAETAGVRLFGSGSRVEKNIINGNYGAGVMVTSGGAGNTITQNAIYDNGTVVKKNGAAASGQLGIDLLRAGDSQSRGTAPYVTLNDTGDADVGGNDLFNYPVFESAEILGGNLVLRGFARPGSLIELFAAAPDSSGFGEGRTYLVSVLEGSAADAATTTDSYGPGAVGGRAQGSDTAQRFRFSVPLPAGVSAGTQLTATATCLSANGCTSATNGSTSEFSGVVAVTPAGANLALTKTVDLDGPQVGDLVTYTLTVTNSGLLDATNVVVNDTLVAGLLADRTNGCAEDVNGYPSCSLGNLAVGGSKSYTLTAIVLDTGGSGEADDLGSVRRNSATVSADQTDPDLSDNTDSADVTVSGLELTKLVCNSSATDCSVLANFSDSVAGSPGDVLEYRITYQRFGIPIFDTVLSDTVPSNTVLEEDVYPGASEVTLRCPNGTNTVVETGAVTALSLDLATHCNLNTATRPDNTTDEAVLDGENGYFLFRARIR